MTRDNQHALVERASAAVPGLGTLLPYGPDWTASLRSGTAVMLRNELEEHIPHLRRYARALARNRDLADDLVQETLLRALDAEERWRGGNLRVWLFTIL